MRPLVIYLPASIPSINLTTKGVGIMFRARRFINIKNLDPPTIILNNTQIEIVYIILPVLYYGILLWGTQSERLYRLQKRIIRIITNSYFIAHSEPIYKSLNLLKLPDMLYKLYYKIKHQTVPTYFKTVLIHMHNPYNTRHQFIAYPKKST